MDFLEKLSCYLKSNRQLLFPCDPILKRDVDHAEKNGKLEQLPSRSFAPQLRIVDNIVLYIVAYLR